MKGTQLGEFEELVLLVVGVLFPEAYGLSIREEIINQTKRKVAIGAVHSALSRLEEKGFLQSNLAENNHELRNSLFNQIPELALKVIKLSGY
jgi:PadR family transcriptional regulator PadR